MKLKKKVEVEQWRVFELCFAWESTLPFVARLRIMLHFRVFSFLIFVSRRVAENRRLKRCASRAAKVVASMSRHSEANEKANGDGLQAEP